MDKKQDHAGSKQVVCISANERTEPAPDERRAFLNDITRPH